MTAKLSVLVLAASLQLDQPAHVPTLPPSAVVPHNITVLRDWVSAVQRHTPGEVDSAALVPTTWSRAELQQLWVDIRALVAVIRNPRTKYFFVGSSRDESRLRASNRQPTELVKIFTTAQDLEMLRKLANDIKLGIGVNQFFRRAAVLHSDLIMVVQADRVEPLDTPGFGPRRTVIQTEDGQQTSLHGGDINWEFGRMLLAEVTEPSADETVRMWYRATMSYKLTDEELDGAHFDAARQLFRDDAEIQFLLGALHEAFADPRVQASLDTLKLPPGVRVDVQPERLELMEAERYLARAIQLDPKHVEARVRRGRVLGRMGRHREAVGELRRALETNRDELLTYFGQLFVGASEEALGQFAAARIAYEQAAAVYPHAQAPVIASSQLLHRTGDRQAAHAGLQPVLQPANTKSLDDDPWWTYHVAAGRFTNARTAALYRALHAAAVKP